MAVHLIGNLALSTDAAMAVVFNNPASSSIGVLNTLYSGFDDIAPTVEAAVRTNGTLVDAIFDRTRVLLENSTALPSSDRVGRLLIQNDTGWLTYWNGSTWVKQSPRIYVTQTDPGATAPNGSVWYSWE